MKKLAFITLTLLIITTKCFSQYYNWAKIFDGPNVTITDIDNDANGNKFIVGTFPYSGAQVDLDPGPGNYMLSSAQGMDFYAKYDGNGNFLWARAINMHFTGVKSMPDGNIMMSGNYAAGSNIDVDPGTSLRTLTANGNDLILCTYSGVDGSFIKVMQFQTSTGDYNNPGYMSTPPGGLRNAIEFDSNGNFYICGSVRGKVDNDLTTDNIITEFETGPYGCGYALKYSPGGERLGGVYILQTDAQALRRDADGNVFVVTRSTEISPGNSFSFFKFDNTCSNEMIGSLIQLTGVANLEEGLPIDIITDNGQNFYINGTLSATIGIDLDPGFSIRNFYGDTVTGKRSYFLAKYNKYGDLLWAKKTGIKRMGMANGKIIALVEAQGAHVPLDINGNPSDTSGTFLAVYNLDGELVQAKKIFTQGNILSDNININTFKVKQSEIYLGGTFLDSCDFDLETSNGNFNNSAGYIAKYNLTYTNGIDLPEFTKDINIFPNPAQDELHIRLDKAVQIDQICINDLGGRLLHHVNATQRYNNIVVDVAQLNTGIYILQLKSGNEKASFKFVKK
jgi:hypothetical protein